MKVTARLMPPEMIGISMASVSRPSSGNWKATDSKVAIGQEPRRERPEEHDHGDQRQQQANILGAELAGEAAQRTALSARSVSRSAQGHAAILCRMPARIWPSGAFDSVIAIRMIAPTIILKA